MYQQLCFNIRVFKLIETSTFAGVVTKKNLLFSFSQFGFFFSPGTTKNFILQQHQRLPHKKNEISCSNNFTAKICILELRKTVATQFKFYDMVLLSILWKAADVVYIVWQHGIAQTQFRN